jgi:Ca2+:H+ antiporter
LAAQVLKLTGSLVTNSGRSAWFIGALVVIAHMIAALTLYLLPRQGG